MTRLSTSSNPDGESSHPPSPRRARRVGLAVALAVATAFALGTVGTAHVFGSSVAGASGASSRPSFVIGSPMSARRISRLQMLSATVGVGIAPIVTFSGRLLRGYLVRTEDGGATWRVTGVFPRGVYPWTTAFITPGVGYAIDSTGALLTTDAGRTWAAVATTGSPLSISVRGRVAWIFVERCRRGGGVMNGHCATRLDAYVVGARRPTSVAIVPGDQPFASQVGPTSGYVAGGGVTGNRVFTTTDDGRTWRLVASPCSRGGVSGAIAVSPSRLFLYCGVGSTILYASSDGGVTWHRRPSPSGSGFDVAGGSTGTYLWQFDSTLWESHDEGRTWAPVTDVKLGPSGAIATYGAHDAWHAVPGHGIYRTTNGVTWALLR